ncbi:C6 zinc finger domain-containing protein [Plectosphaerella cucumerina]|uniref:C6 zinc finger domain-containing protein n=1 Tax=Plectosphaerella cucumerina TaxID=40658 RepID=A0A8K0TF95_9PEZI|nr:C6 zinc finger domain-containing protein [Plectosphaerella cucumerina]
MASLLPELDDISTDPRFLELQEQLRDAVFTGLSTLSPSRWATPEPQASSGHDNSEHQRKKRRLDCASINIPQIRLLKYLTNWVTECAPYLDKFDEARHFQIQVPILAQTSPALFYAILAFSARQMERRNPSSPQSYDSLELYQQSIRALGPSLQAKDPSILVTACILAVFELMAGSSKDWRRHLEGCAGLFEFFGVNGFSGGLPQTVFWCYARMELCGEIISSGTETTMLPLDKWAPGLSPGKYGQTTGMTAEELFWKHSHNSCDTYANFAVYLCAEVCNLRYRLVRYLGLGERDELDSRPFTQRWEQLWLSLQKWYDQRPRPMLPIIDAKAKSAEGHLFPTILFSHWAAISSNQLYHAACILMLEMRRSERVAPEFSAVWHARRICGISGSNPHLGSLINAIQPLYLAGKIFTHVSERREVARILLHVDRATGWGALWRLRDLEAEWGYEPGEMLNVVGGGNSTSPTSVA